MHVRDQCFRQSSASGCARSNSNVRVCLRSVKFFRVGAQCSVVLVNIEFLKKYGIAHSAVLSQIPSHRVRLSVLGQIISCSHSMLRLFVEYRISQLKDERTLTYFFRSRKIVKRTKLINSALKLEAHKTSRGILWRPNIPCLIGCRIRGICELRPPPHYRTV